MSDNQYEDDQRSMEREVRADKKKGLKIGLKFPLSQRALENPVHLAFVGDRKNNTCSENARLWIVQNEGGDKLCSPRSQAACEQWCADNNCAPIPKGWAHFHKHGYPAHYHPDEKKNALLVIATTPEIRFFLMQKDPQALAQVERALGNDKPTKAKFPVTFKKVAQMERAARAQEERQDNEASPYPYKPK